MASPTLLGAIQTRFDAQVTGFASSGGLWVEEIPPDKIDPGTGNPALPFCVLDFVSEKPEWTTEADYIEETLFDFIVHAAPLATAESLAATIKAKFDLPGTDQANAALSVTSAYVFECVRTNYDVHGAEYRDAGGAKVWEIVVSYRALTRKTLA